MSFDWLQHAFLMVTVIVILMLILDVCVSNLKIFSLFIKISFNNICLIILKVSALMLLTVLM